MSDVGFEGARVDVGAARRIIGITGCPGSGKSTLAAGLALEHPETHVVVPMDGFHFANRELFRLGRWMRKGAPDDEPPRRLRVRFTPQEAEHPFRFLHWVLRRFEG